MAACVFGGARLISSASTMLAKTGPVDELNSRRPPAPSCRMSVPVMSIGIRSGVNWMRLNFSDIVSASLLTSSVLARPGTPISRRVPAGEQADRQPLDDVVLADDDAAEFATQFARTRRGGDRSPARRCRKATGAVAHRRRTWRALLVKSGLPAERRLRAGRPWRELRSCSCAFKAAVIIPASLPDSQQNPGRRGWALSGRAATVGLCGASQNPRRY